MDTDTFDHFLTLAETLSLTKAAQKLGKAESVISRQISRYESVLGFKLFERNRNGFVLTNAGAVMQKAILANRSNYENAAAKARSLANGHEAVINVGFLSSHMFPDSVRQIFVDFQAAYPDYHINLSSHGIKQLSENLASGKLDLVFGAPVTFEENEKFGSFALTEVAHCLLLYPDHPMLAQDRKNLIISDFKDDVFLVIEGHWDVYANIQRLGKYYDFHPKIRTVDDYSVLISLVQLRQGISFEDATCFYFTAGGIVPVMLPDLGTVQLGLIGRKSNTDLATRALYEFARKYSQTD